MNWQYPYPSLLPLLQFPCTVDEFKRSVGPRVWPIWHKASLYAFKPEADYWRTLPHYTYTECPLCRLRYVEPVNTYSLGTWGSTRRNFEKNLYVYEDYPLPKKCEHFLGIHLFINLNNVPPTEVRHFENNTGEVPFASAEWLPDEIASYVVLHALPICRIEGEAFVPRYTVFSLCYFSQNPKQAIEKREARYENWGKSDVNDYGPLSSFGFPSTASEQEYNLANWAQIGKLGWLDFTDPQLPLRIGPKSELPATYRNINGLRFCHVWREGTQRKVLPY